VGVEDDVVRRIREVHADLAPGHSVAVHPDVKLDGDVLLGQDHVPEQTVAGLHPGFDSMS